MVVIPGLAGTQYKVRIRLRAHGWGVGDGERLEGPEGRRSPHSTQLSAARKGSREHEFGGVLPSEELQ